MNEHNTLIAFLAVIAALIGLQLIGAWTKSPADLAVMTGLIGLGGALIPRRASPAPVEQGQAAQATADAAQDEANQIKGTS